MPSDIDAVVISNARLSDDYCILALEAPEIAALAQPGQFVMVNPSRGMDPLLRRPFSIFEILRDADGTPTGISLLNKPERGLPVSGHWADPSSQSIRRRRPGWWPAASGWRRF